MAETAKPKAAAKPKAETKSLAPKKPAPAAKTASNSKAVVKASPAKGKTENVTAKVKADMNDFKTKATDGAKAAAEKGKERATEAVGSIGKLIRDSAATIDENVGKQYGDYARGAADAVEGFATKLDAKDVDVIAEDARQFVRKSPALAIGAAAAVGFVLARLFRSGGKDS
ncbi:MAG: hypothetical protein ACKVOS_03260 [Sphingorhabdus sp.]|uniref:hypothetical protein n=1 Tax=Sphingorhabdus sp. TaxID=1902408 RepID=UPI0038FCAAB4